jgi:hypothetical protein
MEQSDVTSDFSNSAHKIKVPFALKQQKFIPLVYNFSVDVEVSKALELHPFLIEVFTSGSSCPCAALITLILQPVSRCLENVSKYPLQY